MSFSDTHDLNRVINKWKASTIMFYKNGHPLTNACWDICHGTLVAFSIITQVNKVWNTTDNNNFIVRSKQLKSQYLN